MAVPAPRLTPSWLFSLLDSLLPFACFLLLRSNPPFLKDLFNALNNPQPRFASRLIDRWIALVFLALLILWLHSVDVAVHSGKLTG